MERAGPFEFWDFIRAADGVVPDAGRWFTPAILHGESGNYLYYGFCPAFRFSGMGSNPFSGAMMVKLSDNMHTTISDPVCAANGVDTAKPTAPAFLVRALQKKSLSYPAALSLRIRSPAVA